MPVHKIRSRARSAMSTVNVIAAFVRDHGCIPVMYGIVRDDRETFEAALPVQAGNATRS